MNFKKFINSDYLKENPLCDIDTYKDELNLATGICTRNIKKLVLTGEEKFILKDRPDTASYLYALRLYHKNTIGVCSHLPYTDSYPRTFPGFRTDASLQLMYMCIGPELQEAQPDGNTVEGFRYYLASQYAAGTPVTIWYVLAEPTTETITVPSGLSGTEEGYLIQDGTPTPTNPIYPTANTIEKWFDINCYVHKTDIDTTTTLPAIIYPTVTTATVGLKGNTVQNGTPTPSNPVEVNGVGERAANMFDVNGEYSLKSSSVTIADNSIKFENVPSGNTARIIYSAQYAAGNYYISCVASGANYTIRLFSDSSFTGATYNSYYGGYYRDFAKSGFSTSLTFDNDFKIGFIANAEGGATFTIHDIMLSTTEVDFEPYGYKIPISSANTTTPVYLGEVETTRKIKKVVLTGKGVYTKDNGGEYLFWTTENTQHLNHTDCFCSHLPSTRDYPRNQEGCCTYRSNSATIYLNFGADIMNSQPSGNTNAGIKEYIAAQYAAGTPVTIWCVLEEPETAVVNEPLMKIGDYADEVSDVTIPTIVGKNTLDVETTLKPSEASINYTGWHDTEVKGYISDTDIADWEKMSIAQMENHTIQELQGGNWV